MSYYLSILIVVLSFALHLIGVISAERYKSIKSFLFSKSVDLKPRLIPIKTPPHTPTKDVGEPDLVNSCIQELNREISDDQISTILDRSIIEDNQDSDSLADLEDDVTTPLFGHEEFEGQDDNDIFLNPVARHLTCWSPIGHVSCSSRGTIVTSTPRPRTSSPDLGDASHYNHQDTIKKRIGNRRNLEMTDMIKNKSTFSNNSSFDVISDNES